VRSYKQWAVKALADMGQRSEAIRYAEACRGSWTSDPEVDALVAPVGLVDESR
jgi:hypothetical protein